MEASLSGHRSSSDDVNRGAVDDGMEQGRKRPYYVCFIKARQTLGGADMSEILQCC